MKGFGVPKRVAAVLDFYGATHFDDEFWSSPLTTEEAPDVEESFINLVYQEKPVATRGGVSLEGQAPKDGAPALTPRAAFAFTHIANGTLMDACFPSKDFKRVDAVMNIDDNFPPTCIVHGTADTKVPMRLSKELSQRLRRAGVPHEFIEVPGEEHTFAGQMKKASKTWEIQRKAFDWLEDVVSRRRS